MQIQFPDVPPRTKVEALVDLETSGSTPHVFEFTCIDCGFTTQSQSEMQLHQDNQKQHHSIWQQFRRFFT